ncbi:MAG: zinc metallopeptidase [Aquincola sp.]|nr:zinc metallopeptidase [Aquincola sp.]
MDNELYYVILGGTYLFALVVRQRLTTTYAKYARVSNRAGLSGAEVARGILDANGLRNVQLELARGKLTDHYDPRTRVIRSPSITPALRAWPRWRSSCVRGSEGRLHLDDVRHIRRRTEPDLPLPDPLRRNGTRVSSRDRPRLGDRKLGSGQFGGDRPMQVYLPLVEVETREAANIVVLRERPVQPLERNPATGLLAPPGT